MILTTPNPVTESFYTKNAREILERYTGDNRRFLLDIGAHVGGVSIVAVKEYGFDCAVAVEADLENFARMLDNIAMNDCEGKVLPIWAAVTSKSRLENVILRSIPEQPGQDNSGAHSLYLRSGLPGQNVMSLMLSDIPRPATIDFLKVDIEGGEWELFSDCYNEQVLNDSQWIDIEFHGESGDSKLEEYIRSNFNVSNSPITSGLYGNRR